MSTETWEEARSAGIGGSDAAACMGLSPFTTALQLWRQKLGLIPGPSPSAAMEWGNRLERAVLDKMAEDAGLVLVPPEMVAAEILGEDTGSTKAQRVAEVIRGNVRPKVYDDGHVLWVPSRPLPYGADVFALATVDGFGVLDTGEVVMMEAKTTGEWGKKRWDEGVPDHVRLQVQHYLAVMGLERAFVGCLAGGRTFFLYEDFADDDLIGAMFHAEKDMVRRIVEDDPPPEVERDIPPEPRTKERQVRIQLKLGEAGALHGMLDTMIAAVPDAKKSAAPIVALRDKLAKAVVRGAAT